MTDWHTHILPAMDDGSKSIEESIEMLLCEINQGVDRIMLTSHFYAFDEEGDSFVSRREAAFEKLKLGISKFSEENSKSVAIFPEMILAAEIYLYDRLHKMESLKDLTFYYRGKRHVLIEMPFDSWTDRNINEVYMTAQASGAIPVMAHIERYLKYKGNERRLEDIVNMGAVLQINSEYLESKLNRIKVGRIIKRLDANVVFGTDCHNMKSRKPDWSGAIKFIR